MIFDGSFFVGLRAQNARRTDDLIELKLRMIALNCKEAILGFWWIKNESNWAQSNLSRIDSLWRKPKAYIWGGGGGDWIAEKIGCVSNPSAAQQYLPRKYEEATLIEIPVSNWLKIKWGCQENMISDHRNFGRIKTRRAAKSNCWLGGICQEWK